MIFSAKNLKMIERGLHEVPFPRSCSLCCMPSEISTYSRDQTTSTETDISSRACVGQGWVPSQTSTRSTCRCAPCCFFSFCWFEASVRPEIVRPGPPLWSKELQDSERPNGTYTKCCFLDFPVVITVGNHHVFMGPDDLNGCGYFPRTLMLLCALLHICAYEKGWR